VNRAFTIATTAAVLLVSGCRGQTAEDPPVQIMRNMHHQQRYNPQSVSAFYHDRRTMRPVPEGTVPREEFFEDERVETGVGDNGYVDTIPPAATEHFGGAEGLLARGRERFTIYCTPCHGQTGDGNGIVPVRALETKGYQYAAPPTWHADRVRHLPDGQIFATITNGVRNMPSYAAQIPIYDRWAIVSYVRALQLSQAQAGTTTAQNTTGVAQ
jgi:mono/diheme cytochrome c family protein